MIIVSRFLELMNGEVIDSFLSSKAIPEKNHHCLGSGRCTKWTMAKLTYQLETVNCTYTYMLLCGVWWLLLFSACSMAKRVSVETKQQNWKRKPATKMVLKLSAKIPLAMCGFMEQKHLISIITWHKGFCLHQERIYFNNARDVVC